MRYLYFACISVSFVLFLSNHAHARIRESYADSVVRYTAEGFTESRSSEQVSLDYENELWAGPGVKEVTWTYKDPQGLGEFGLISIRQLFWGQWPPTRQPEKNWKKIMHCVEITYRFKDPLKDPKKTPEIKLWVEALVKKSLERFKPAGGYPVHGIIWEPQGRHEKMDFIIDAPPHDWSGHGTSRGLFHTEGKSLTIQLGENHWPFKKYSGRWQAYKSSCWRTDRDMKEAQKRKQLADREKQLQLMRDAAAKEIAESGL